MDESVHSLEENKSVSNESVAPPPLAHNETVAVRQTKRLVLLVLVIAAAVVALLVYFVAAKDERDNFVSDVQTFDNEIIENAELIMRDYASVLQSLSTTMTSNAVSGHQPWPNVSVPFFEIRANEAKIKSGMDVFMVAPLVQAVDRLGWESYTTTHQHWLDAGLKFQELDVEPGDMPRVIHSYTGDVTKMVDNRAGPFAPVWHVGAAPTNASVVNLDLLSHKDVRDVIKRVLKTGKAVLSPILDVEFLIQHSNIEEEDDRRQRRMRKLERIREATAVEEGQEQDEPEAESEEAEGSVPDVAKMESEGEEEDENEEEERSEDEEEEEEDEGPRALIVQPIFETFEEYAEIKAFVIATFPWSRMFDNAEVIQDMDVVLSTSCGRQYTYQINMFAKLKGVGDLHQHAFNHLRRTQYFVPFQEEWQELIHAIELDEDSTCKYTFDIYPTKELLYGENEYVTRYPMLYALVVVFIFSGTSLAFIMYDFMVQRRQNMVMSSAASANAIVASMFPATVQERILKNAEEQVIKKSRGTARQSGIFLFGGQQKAVLNRVHSSDSLQEEREGLVTAYSTKPIADLFTEATIMFADIAGFTAWSSVREASQVFTLLETVYAAFDKVAKCLKVFKVETIGDCYVAVAGLPVPRNNHAPVMASFALKCLRRFEDLSRKLEVILGPGTGSLGLRVGLHSGPVTAGVLRGDNARFQLFGDTVNVASRMESTGERGKIQVSNETAALLLKAGVSLTLRAEKIEAKGKGKLQTYWLDLSDPNASSNGTAYTGNVDENDEAQKGGPAEAPMRSSPSPMRDEMNRLIEWNANNLVQLLRVLHARRSVCKSLSKPGSLHLLGQTGNVTMVLDEVKEIIELPQFDEDTAKKEIATSHMQLKEEVFAEVRLYVKEIASRYKSNPFHNFEHASHVTMSVVKLLSRISNPTEWRGEKTPMMRSQHHLDTYGITSDPLTCFGCVFSALIHDVDHPGISNAQLVVENGPLVKLYNGKSVAEQNSVDTAWKLLMEDRFVNFRQAIFANDTELVRFRQILVNSVMATDIMDKELKHLRDTRWEKAFQAKEPKEATRTLLGENIEECINRKATIVIEHLIQASDVAHTMQHWHIYRKWNEKLYQEMYQAYRDGRSQTDPTDGWYQGEIGFFDFYIIPLAKKLADCGVFGVSSFEYLNFAVRNRDEWIVKGQQIVREMRQMVEAGESRFIEV